jgi:hypothetical protein
VEEGWVEEGYDVDVDVVVVGSAAMNQYQIYDAT